MKQLLLIILLSTAIFGQSGKSNLTQQQKDSIAAMISDSLSGFTGSYTLSGVVREVGSDRDYTTISSAITAASDGDIIKVYNGTYSANLVVNKSVKIVGDNATITGTVNIFSDNVTLKDLAISKSSDSALVIDGADNVLIDNVDVTGTGTMIHFKDANNCKYVDGIIKTLRVIYTNSSVVFKPTKQYVYHNGTSLRAINSTVEYQSIMRMISNITGNDTITRTGGAATSGSDIYINNSDMVTGFALSDSSNITISNSTFTKYPYLSIAGSSSGIMRISNCHIEMNYPDTVSGLHVFEVASSGTPIATGKLIIENSTVFFGNDTTIKMGGSLAALTVDTMFTFKSFNSTFIGYADNISGLAYKSVFAMNRPTFELNKSTVKYINNYGTDGSAISIGEITDSYINGTIINTYLEAPLSVLYMNEALTTNQVRAVDSIKFIQNTVNCIAGVDTNWFDFEITNDYVGRNLIIKYDGAVPSASTEGIVAVEYDTVKTKVLFIGGNEDHEVIPVYPTDYETTAYNGVRFTDAVAGDTIYIKFTWEDSLSYRTAYAECLLNSVQNDKDTRVQMWKLDVYHGGAGSGTYGRAVVDTSEVFTNTDGYYELNDVKYYASDKYSLTIMAQMDGVEVRARKQVISLFIKSSYNLDSVIISLTP